MLRDLLGNEVLWASVAAWAVAQTLKVVFFLIKEKRLNLVRLVETGGMPSSHSAFVTGLATAVAAREGIGSPLFAAATVFALIVMYDAAGIRQAAGRQAETLNRLIDDYYRKGRIRPERLKELLGHTPVEVVAGAVVGLLIALAVV